MRGATQTRKRRVGWSMERTRFTYRYVRGLEIALGGRHQGYYSDGQHAALRMCPFLWLGMLILLGVTHAHIWVISLVFVQLIWTALFLPALFIWWAVRRAVAWWQFRGQLDAFAQTAGELLGWPEYVRPYLWLHLPMNWRKRSSVEIRIEMKYDAANSEEKQKKILQAVATGLGQAIDPRYVTWNTAVKPSPWPWLIVWPSLTIRPESPPPDRAMFGDNLPLIEGYRKPSQIPLGIGLSDTVEVIDIDDDAPHAVIAADSGRGKSSVEALIGCVLAHKGCVLVILDPKQVSLQAFKGLPNVVYCAGEEQAHLGLLALRAELKRRAESLADVEWGVAPPPMGARLVVLIEESDSLVDELRNWKEDTGEGRSNVRSISAMNRLRNMGRELMINIFVVTQTGGAQALGGVGSQTGFGFQLISANHEAVWKKLAPQVKDVPTQSKHRGRWHLNKPGSGAFPIEVQCFGFPDPPEDEKHLKFADARAYAVSGELGEVPESLRDLNHSLDGTLSKPSKQAADPLGHGWPTSRDNDSPAHVMVHTPHAASSRPHLSVVEDDRPDPDRLMTLAEAMRAKILPFETIDAARSAAGRGAFGEPAKERRQVGPGQPAKQWPVSVFEEYTRNRG